jgi:hypothetical protein
MSTCDESKNVWVFRQLKDKRQDNLERKAWYQTYKSSNALVWTCPEEHIRLNARQFLVVTQTYFGVKHECL